MKTGFKIALSLLMILQILLFIHAFFKMSAENIGWMTVIFLNAGFFYINTLTFNKVMKDSKQ
jgi:hypothetical protein